MESLQITESDRSHLVVLIHKLNRRPVNNLFSRKNKRPNKLCEHKAFETKENKRKINNSVSPISRLEANSEKRYSSVDRGSISRKTRQVETQRSKHTEPQNNSKIKYFMNFVSVAQRSTRTPQIGKPIIPPLFHKPLLFNSNIRRNHCFNRSKLIIPTQSQQTNNQLSASRVGKTESVIITPKKLDLKEAPKLNPSKIVLRCKEIPYFAQRDSKIHDQFKQLNKIVNSIGKKCSCKKVRFSFPVSQL